MEHPIGAPKDWNEAEHGKCGGLFVRADPIDGLMFLRSAWQPSKTELAALNGGASVLLGVSGQSHPVVNMGVGPTPDDAAPFITGTQSSKLDGTRFLRVEVHYGAGVAGFCEVSMPEGCSIAQCLSAGAIEIDNLAKERGWVS